MKSGCDTNAYTKWSVVKLGLNASPSSPRSLYPPLRSVVTVGTVANVVAAPLAATRIAPDRSAKKSRPSGAHASAVAKFAPSTNTDWPGGPLTLTGGDAHGSGGAVTGTVVVGVGSVVVLGDRDVRASFAFDPPHALSTATITAITTTRPKR